MKLIACLFIVLISQVGWSQPEFVDSPSQCFSKKVYPCHLRVTGGFLAFEKGTQKYHLADQSSLLLNSESEIQLLQGQIWIKDSRELVFKATSALKLLVSGEMFFQKLPDSTLLARNLHGEIQFQSKYVFSNETLPEGFQNWYGGLDSTGQISRGVIRPIMLVDFLKVWIPVSGMSMAEMRRSANEYRERWGDALNQSSSLYQQVVERRMASQEEKVRKAAEKKKAQLEEQKRLRQMFREKNGFE